MPVNWDEFQPVTESNPPLDWSQFSPVQVDLPPQKPELELPKGVEPGKPGEQSVYEEPTWFDKSILPLGDLLIKGEGESKSKTEEGITSALRPALNSLTTPRNITYLLGSMGIASTGTAGKLLVSSLWTGLMGKNAAEDAPQIYGALGEEMAKPEKDRDQKKIASLLTEGGIDAVMAIAPAVHGISELGKSLKPSTPEVTDASKIGETEKVYGAMRPQPEQGVRQVPVEESGKGVQLQGPPKEGQLPLTVTETTPVVPPEEMPETPSKTGLYPAIREVGGKVDVASAGETHPDIIKKEGLKAEDIDQRGFVNEKGEFKDREQASQISGVPTQREAARQHSTDLPEAKSGQMQLSIVPGAKEFIEQDVIPKTVEGAKAVSDSVKGTQALLSAPTVSEPARLGAGIIRERAAELAQKDVQARKEFSKARSEMGKWNKNQSLQFIDKVESGSTTQLSPELQKTASGLRQAFNDRVREVRSLGTGKLQHVIQDYFPHIWKQPDPAASIIARILGKRPLVGPKSFLKQRTIPRTVDGISAGLEPVSWNPIDLSLLKIHEMDRYVMGQKIIQEFKDKGLAQFSRSDIPPAGYAKINDNIANVIEYRPTTKADGTPGAPERILHGHWYAQEDAARVLNNYLSPGLERFAWYRALRWFGNNLNMANLGFSAYHFMFSMIDTSTSKLSLGLEQVIQGKFKEGAKNIGKGIGGIPMANQLEAYLKGSKVLQEYSKPGSVGGEYTKIVDALLAGGGRVEMPQIFQNSTLKNFFDAAKSGNYPGAVLRAPFAAIHAAAYPLMNVAIPRLKLGVFSDMARHEMERIGPSVTRDQFRASMGKIWDSVDNRLGELVYDNLFWNKSLKDLSFLGVRSVGWNLGTVRELGGAPVDAATNIKRLKQGELITTRKIGYLFSLPITVGIMGAIYQKLRTGQGPQELKDYFYPKTGNTLPNGEPERVNFPSYLKDIVSFKRHPVQTVVNKAHPSIGLVANMLQNKDYYGTEIIHPDDPLIQKIKDESEFIVKAFKPYSAQGAQKRTDIETGIGPAVESFFGIMPLPSELTRTPAENLAIELLRNQMPKGSRTKEQSQRADSERKVIAQIKMGKMNVDEAVQKGLITEERRDVVERRADMSYLDYAVSRLNASSAMKVYEKATPKERSLISDRVEEKIDNAKSITEEERDLLRQRFEKLQ